MDSSEGLARKYQSSICTTSRVLSRVRLPLSIRSSITKSPANATMLLHWHPGMTMRRGETIYVRHENRID